MTDNTPPADPIDARRQEVIELVNSNRRRNKWLKLAAMALVVGGIGTGLWFWRKSATAVVPVEFETAAITRGALEETVTATGTLSSVDAVELGAEVTGRIVKLTVDVNDPVQAGQVLAEIDADQLSARVKESQAQLQSAVASQASAKATLAEAELKQTRLQALFERGLASPQEVETGRATEERARASLASAAAQITVARAGLDSNKTALRKSIIVSPIDGVVLARNVELGQTLTAGFQTPILFTLSRDLAQLELNVEVDEADIGKVAEAQHAKFMVDAYPGRSFDSKLIKLHNLPTSTDVASTVVTYPAVLSVDNRERLLRPGMTATATITTRTFEDVLLVRTAALRFKPPRPVDPGRSFLPFMRGSRPSSPTAAPALPLGARPEDQVWVLADGKPRAVPVGVLGGDGLQTAIEVTGEPPPLAAGSEALLQVKAPREP